MPRRKSRWDEQPAGQAAREETLLPVEKPADESGPFVLEITDVLDLHTFAPRDVGVVVEAYLDEARVRGFRQVRIIHGKGIGVQRELVRAILERTPHVVHFEQAPAGAGSWGATVAILQVA